MALAAFLNPIWTIWPEGLMLALAVVCLVGVKALRRDATIGAARGRLVSVLGLLVTAGTVLLGLTPSYYTILAIFLIPAPFAFGALTFNPRLIVIWTKGGVYLTLSLIASALAWAVQSVWLITR